MKILVALALLAVVALGVFFWLPYQVGASYNRISGAPPGAPSTEARTLHSSLTVADLHADSLLWARDLDAKGDWGHVDLPRLREGNLALQTFSAVTKTPRGLNLHENPADSDMITALAMAQRWPPQTWGDLTERALYQARRLQALAETDRQFVVITSQLELADFIKWREREPNMVAGLLSLEGAHALEDDLGHLRTLYDAGYRMMAPTHFFDTFVSGSAHGVEKGGLTADGEAWVREMDRLSIIIDLAHASPQAMDDILALSSRPVVVSHTGVQGTCPGVRNLSDDYLRRIAATGGLIGIGFWEAAVCGNTVQDIVRAIRHAVDVVGVRHVALGSDFDGAVAVPFDASSMVMLTDGLLQAGFSAEDIRRIAGENLIDFLLQNLPESG